MDLKLLNNWKAIIQNWVYPPTCLLCGDPGHNQLDLCEPCHCSFPQITHNCIRCGIPLNSAEPDLIQCGDCLNKPPLYDLTQAYHPYEFSTAFLVRELKYRRNLASARLMAQLMIEKTDFKVLKPECLIPVPLHHARYRDRGFNQSEEIAKVIAETMAIELNTTSCKRIKQTTSQTSLAAVDRLKNLRDAFEVKLPPHVKQVAIIDDVITTGSTVNELARSLRAAGVEKIQVWAFARA